MWINFNATLNMNDTCVYERRVEMWVSKKQLSVIYWMLRAHIHIHMYLCLYIQRRTMCLTLFLSFYLFYDWLTSFVAPKWWHTVSVSIVCVSALFLELIKCCEFCEESIMSWNCAIEHGGGAGVAIMIVNFSLFHVSFPPIQWTNVTE